MASLSKNGTELGRIHRLWHTDAHFSNGKILRNAGFGWKQHAAVKVGIDPKQHFANMQARQAAARASKPALTALAEFLHPIPLTRRWKLKSALELLGPEEADGIWSSVNDYEHTYTVDEINELCKLYKAAMHEQAALRQQQQQQNQEQVNAVQA